MHAARRPPARGAASWTRPAGASGTGGPRRPALARGFRPPSSSPGRRGRARAAVARSRGRPPNSFVSLAATTRSRPADAHHDRRLVGDGAVAQAPAPGSGREIEAGQGSPFLRPERDHEHAPGDDRRGGEPVVRRHARRRARRDRPSTARGRVAASRANRWPRGPRPKTRSPASAGVAIGPSNEPSLPCSVGAITLRHSSRPLRASNAAATSFLPSEKSVTARPPATATEE